MRMIMEIKPDANDLVRPYDRSPPSFACRNFRKCFGAASLDKRFQRIKTAARQKIAVPIAKLRRQISATALHQYPRSFAAPFPKPN